MKNEKALFDLLVRAEVLTDPCKKFIAVFTCPATGGTQRVVVCEHCREEADQARKEAGITVSPKFEPAFMWAKCEHCGR